MDAALMLPIGGGMLVGAFYACRYVALTFFYFVCQPAMMEDYVVADPLHVAQENEGRLVYVQGTLNSDERVRDPLYGIASEGVGLWREVTAAPDAPTPQEAHLQSWGSGGSAPPKVGSYELRGSLMHYDFPMAQQHVKTIFSLASPMRDVADVQPNGVLHVTAEGGAVYKVRFLTQKSSCFRFLGRQHGSALEQDTALKTRQDMIENQAMPQDALFRMMRKLGLMLPIAWLATFLGLWTLRHAAARRIPAQRVPIAAAFAAAAVIAWRVFQHISAGALVRHLDRVSTQWSAIDGLFHPTKAAVWSISTCAFALLCTLLTVYCLRPTNMDSPRR